MKHRIGRWLSSLLILCAASTVWAGSFYVSHWDMDGTIHRYDAATLASQCIIPNGVIYPFQMAVDPIGEKLYWLESAPARVCRANLDGSDVEVVTPCGGCG